ncbi:unnamed protein product [Penicillium glandicola]
MNVLLPDQLEVVVATVAQRLDSLQIDYAIMGGAAICLIAPDPQRATEDVDLVIRVDHRSITADMLTNKLLTSFPSDFGPVNLFGHILPAYKLHSGGGAVTLVHLEVFDQANWPNRPQYDLQKATRLTKTVKGYPVKLFGSEWLLREKILSQYQRQGFKQSIDLQDVGNILKYCVAGKTELNFDHDQELRAALTTILERRPRLRTNLSRVIKCQEIFDCFVMPSALYQVTASQICHIPGCEAFKIALLDLCSFNC